jgi:3-hydroxyisobutyrate dehydrogenase
MLAEASVARIVLLGTGLLGSGMVKHFLKSGKEVTVWNRTEAKARELETFGASVATTPAAAVAGADRIHIVLPDDAAVGGVVEQMASGLKKGAIIINHSTTLPEATRKRHERLSAQGVRYLHAPVFMSPQMAADGVGLMLVSGRETDFEDVREELQGMTGEVWYLGERADLAAAYKLFGNCMLFAISGGLADIIAMARANDIDAVEAMKLFTKFLPGNVIAARGPRMARNEVSPASFEIKMARKDVGLMMTAAKDQPLVGLPGIAKRMDELIEAGNGDLDITAIGPAAK